MNKMNKMKKRIKKYKKINIKKQQKLVIITN